MDQALINNYKILLTGSTGYVGGRLLKKLLEKGFQIKCLARNPKNIPFSNHQNLTFTKADLLDFESINKALANTDVAFYLAHSLGSAKDFEEKERICAKNFAEAAKKSSIKKIIYLGGLGDDDNLSPHLQSRQEVGKILRESGINVIEFRASIIIGSGSLSYEMVRALVHKLPIMITPTWVRAKAQPISIEDVLLYLESAIFLEVEDHKIFEIGGPDIVSYMGIMKAYAEARGIKRLMIPVPFLTPYLSSLWLGLVTPLYARIGRKLIDSIRHDTLVNNKSVDQYFKIKPRGLKESIKRALINEDKKFAQTKWHNALSSSGERKSWEGIKFGSRIIDSRKVELNCSLSSAFKPIREIGGENGWYYANWAWEIRGFIDLLFGGVGTRRGRRSSETLSVGETLDFWRVEEFKDNHLLRLKAEMKLPGRAWLQFEVSKKEDELCIIQQTAIFDPIGLMGISYWYILYPLHKLIFAGMLKEISKKATLTT